MGRERYYDGTRYYRCRSCGLVFTEKFTIDKVSFEPQVRDMGPPNTVRHKKCSGIPWHSHDDIFYGIGDLIGIGVKDFEEEKE
jgi:rubredoxin